jgi:hypothetical protein
LIAPRRVVDVPEYYHFAHLQITAASWTVGKRRADAKEGEEEEDDRDDDDDLAGGGRLRLVMPTPPPATVNCCARIGVSTATGVIDEPSAASRQRDRMRIPCALSEIETAATRVPVALGVNVTVMVQLAPAGIVALHVFCAAKSAALAPVIATPPTESAAPPTFVSVTI